MYRRALLSRAGVTFAPALAGCPVEVGRGVDAIAFSEPAVRPGETAAISIEAPNLSGLRISEFPAEFARGGTLRLGEATFSPAPEVVWTGYPPYWEFAGDDVEGVVPIETTTETPPDAYEFGFHVRIDDDEEPRTVVTTVTVEGDSN